METYLQEKHKLVAVLLLFPSYFCIVVISYANNGANSCIVVEFFERILQAVHVVAKGENLGSFKFPKVGRFAGLRGIPLR